MHSVEARTDREIKAHLRHLIMEYEAKWRTKPSAIILPYQEYLNFAAELSTIREDIEFVGVKIFAAEVSKPIICANVKVIPWHLWELEKKLGLIIENITSGEVEK